MSLELEIRKRDEIILQLQLRIQELERRKADDFDGDSTEHDASMEEGLDDDRVERDHPFMRHSSTDTVIESIHIAIDIHFRRNIRKEKLWNCRSCQTP